jgi:hypothetical protein
MTRFDVNRMVEDVEECLNQMWASPSITGYKHGCCEAVRLSGCIRVEFKFCSRDAVKLRGYLDASE